MLTHHKESLEEVTLHGHWRESEGVLRNIMELCCERREVWVAVVSGMFHTMHSGYPWRLFHFEEKVK